MSDSQQDSQNDLLDALLGDFLDESDQLLTQLNDNLLQLDEWVRELGEDHHERCDADLLNQMFRAAHSIKGLSGMMGLDDINALTHKIENVFDAARNDQLVVNRDVVDLVFMGVDQLTALVELLKDPDGTPVDCNEVLEGIRKLLQSAGAEKKQTSQADAEKALSDLTNAPVPVPAPVIPDPFDNLVDEDDIPEKYLSIFIDETETTLDELNENLLALEDGEDSQDLNKLLVTSHRIKGSAASIGLNRAAKLAHLMEDLLQNRLESNGVLSPEEIDAFLGCTDALRQFVGNLREGNAESSYFSQAARKLLASDSVAFDNSGPTSLTQRLDSLLAEMRQRMATANLQEIASDTDLTEEAIRSVQQGDNATLQSLRAVATYFDTPRETKQESPSTIEAAPSAQATTNESPAYEGALDEASPDATPVFAGEVQFEPDLAMAELKAILICEKLAKVGHLCYCEPSVEELETLDSLERFSFRISTDEPVEKIVELVRIAGVEKANVQPFASPDTVATTPNHEEAGNVSGKPGEHSNKEQTTPSNSPAQPNNAASRDASVPVESGANPVSSTSGTKPPTQTEKKAKTESKANVSATGSSPNKGTPAKTKQRPTESAGRPAQTVRVDIERLDELMNLAGQLVINKAQFSQIGEKLQSTLSGKRATQSLDRVFRELNKMSSLYTGLDANTHADASTNANNPDAMRLDENHLHSQTLRFHAQARRIQTELETVRNEVQSVGQARDSVKDLLETIHQFDRVSNAVQQAVMDTRMVPIGPLFTRFNRVVRDIAREKGKEIRLEIVGEKTELDKRMIDELSDPLIHMVRNSADHGIESPEVREAAQKPRRGTVTLEAFHRGNSIVIRVSDDGKGLDTERIRKKCIEKEILTEADAEKMSPRQIHQMIWAPGMSTADKITGVSGRGMGMDIVKSKIEGLNGVVDIESSPGCGTTMTIKLPVTLAILPSLMVDIAGDVFAMPLESVTEIVSVSQDQMSTVHGQPVATVRGRVVSRVNLGDTLIFHHNDDAFDVPASQETTLVIVGEPGQEIGLVVNRVIGEEDIVIKSIAENYKNVPGIAGASILGDGRISLILDIPTLIEMIAKKAIHATV